MSKWLKTLEANELKSRSKALGEGVLQSLDSAQKLQAYVKARLETVFLVELLEKLIATLPPENDLYRVLTDNLAEEQGQHPEHGGLDHATSRQQLAMSVGTSLKPHITPEIQAVLARQSADFWLGMLYYIEYAVPAEYARLRDLIRHFFSNADTYHLEDHIEHDKHHFADLHQALLSKEDLDEDTFLAGIGLMDDYRLKLLKTIEA